MSLHLDSWSGLSGCDEHHFTAVQHMYSGRLAHLNCSAVWSCSCVKAVRTVLPVSCVLVCGRCKHNSVYWQSLPFYAFGLGAASLLQGQRFSRPRTMPAYRDWVLNQGCSMPAPGELCPMLETGSDWLQPIAPSLGGWSAVTCPIGCDQALAPAGGMALV